MRKKEKRKKVCASVLALLLSVAMILGMIPGEIGQVYAAEQKQIRVLFRHGNH